MTFPWRDAYETALANDDDSAQFYVLSEPTPAPTGQPLLIWVHPGDAVEDEEAFEDHFDYRESQGLQARMAEEIVARMATHQVVVLHRQSSDWAFDQGYAQYAYGDVFEAISELPTTIHLYGDDLEDAAHWMADYLLPTAREVFLTGAYSDPDHGCVTQVGQVLQARSPSIPVELSRYSPNEPGDCSNQWSPKPPVFTPPPLPSHTPRIPRVRRSGP